MNTCLLLSLALQGSPCELSFLQQVDVTTENDRFGHSLAAAGSRLVVGAPVDEDAGANAAGSTWVYELDQANWSPVVQLVAGDPGQGDRFGGSVALDGDRIVVGAYRDNAPQADSGSAYVFELQGGSWVQTQKLTASDGSGGDHFGESVAASSGRIFVAAPDHGVPVGPGTHPPGAVYVFEQQGSSWVETAKLFEVDGCVGRGLGHGLAADGSRVIAGAPGSGCDDRALVFELVRSLWENVGELWPDPPNGNPVPSSFGAAVALEGDRALVGDWEYTLPGVFYAGAAWVYDRQETGWVRTQRLEATDATEGDAFGSSVALVGDHAFVGAPSAQPAGAVYRFQRFGTSWTEVDVIAPALFPSGAEVGQSVAATAGRFLVGAPGDDGPNAEASAGSVRSYALPAGTYCTAKTASVGCVPTIATSGQANAVGPFDVTASQVLNQKNGLLFYGSAGAAALPFLGGTLCVAPPLRRTGVQSSGGNGPPADCSGAFGFDFAARIASGVDTSLVPGVEVHAQYWFRDTAHPDGSGVGLSDGARWVICP